MNPQRNVPAVPPNMPSPLARLWRDEPARGEFPVTIETTTPILGGAPVTRQIDKVDVIRVPTIRGHLRFWWRALYGKAFATPEKLFEAEARLWGKAADAHGGRSQVEISIEMQRSGQLDPDPAETSPAHLYALWPYRAPADGTAAPGRRAGVQFRLKVNAPVAEIDVVKNVVRAWILFGGYGGRTRRGVGSLTVSGDAAARRAWLPSADDDEGWDQEPQGFLGNLFHPNPFAPSPGSSSFPVLSGTTLLLGPHYPANRAQDAWAKALAWLRDFRQGVGVARDPGHGRPGLSRWPEADKLRHLTGRYGHSARYTDKTPAWPRAEFGLPIVGQFKDQGEPPDFQLTWQIGNDDFQDRMASPVIVKALPTLQGFRPCVLWLARANPPGRVVAVQTKPSPKAVIHGSTAPFGYLGSSTSPAGTAPDQSVSMRLKAPPARKASLQHAFIDWVKAQGGVVQVAP